MAPSVVAGVETPVLDDAALQDILARVQAALSVVDLASSRPRWLPRPCMAPSWVRETSGHRVRRCRAIRGSGHAGR